MKRNLCILFLFIAGVSLLHGQLAEDTFWVEFTDKNNSPFSIGNPDEFLSERAIQRRSRQGISINEEDLPVNQVYVDSLKSLGIEIHNVSKWLNGVVIVSADKALLDTLHNISFVKNQLSQSKSLKTKSSLQNKFSSTQVSDDYGESENQIDMVNGINLHSLGFKGEGMLIAILDAGFTNTHEIESLSQQWENNKIVAWRDFVHDGNDMFDVHSHGTIVFSIIGGMIPGSLHGSAPEADFMLVRTENGGSEDLIEEYNWIAGAEYADSMGADVINSSLGYSEFDDPGQNHTYADMDGYTTPISIGAVMAARKGMLVVTSAGNSGNDPWQYITAPADADSVLAIGAVHPNRTIANFSGKGPAADKRMKPDVSAQGVETYGQVYPEVLSTCNGTSCSSPVMAGMAACLWQSRPQATAQQIRKAIIEASDRYQSPDTLYGYGIPDMLLAQNILDSITPPPSDLTTVYIAPNPLTEDSRLIVTLPWLENTQKGVINFYDTNGRLLLKTYKSFHRGVNIHLIPEAIELEDGFYTLNISIDGRFYKVPFIKL